MNIKLQKHLTQVEKRMPRLYDMLVATGEEIIEDTGAMYDRFVLTMAIVLTSIGLISGIAFLFVEGEGSVLGSSMMILMSIGYFIIYAGIPWLSVKAHCHYNMCTYDQ